MQTGDEGDLLLTPLEAAHHLGITAELLFQFTKRGFGRSSGLRSLRALECAGQTRFAKPELDAFDAMLAGPWPSPAEGRPPIPKAILDHLRAESQNQCARCGSGIGVDTAHIRSWGESRSHHHHNLIRLCSGCHREHDAQHSLTTDELKLIKGRLIERTRAHLTNRIHPSTRGLRPPRAAHYFVGRETELLTLIDALRSRQSILISGAGGIGKSELLVQALGRCEVGRTVLWCDIDQYRTIADILSVLRAAVGSGGTACTEDELSSRLDAVQACVVLDGIEQGSLDNFDSFEDAIKALFDATRDTQFVFTSQIVLHRLPTEVRVKLGRLDEAASRSLLYAHGRQSTDQPVASDPLLEFCDGHALTLRLAGALAEHYGSAAGALNAIGRHGVHSVRLPGRQRHNRKTSLELCLRTAYETLTENSRHLLWALAQAPAGMLTPYLDLPWLELEDVPEALASLRRWNLIDIVAIDKETGRTRLLAPIRRFAIDCGRKEEPGSFWRVINRVVDGFGMMVAVLELKYDKPEDTPYVLQRYGDELPNLLYALNLARERPSEEEIVTTAVSIARSLMRYFFVLRLCEQGAQVMRDAAELALETLRLEQASSLALQLVALAQRAGDRRLIAVGLDMAGRVEAMATHPGVSADAAMCRALAAQEIADFPAAEGHAREALNAYQGQLLALKDKAHVDDRADFRRQELHNDLASALGMLGFALLSQKKYDAAAKAYRHSLQHQRGASIAVNRGQMLHQIGNCESYLGNHKVAAELYIEAAKIFDFVGMEEFLSNALGELGYSLLEIDMPEISDLDESLIDHGLTDLTGDIKRIFDSTHPLDHQQCIGGIRKLFGMVILISLTGHGEKLGSFGMGLAKGAIAAIAQEVSREKRGRDEAFPIMMVDTALHMAVLIAQGEVEFAAGGDISRDTLGEMLRLICAAHEWAQNMMRVIDWFVVYLVRRWKFRGIDADRLRAFVRNFDDDIEDYLDLAR